MSITERARLTLGRRGEGRRGQGGGVGYGWGRGEEGSKADGLRQPAQTLGVKLGLQFAESQSRWKDDDADAEQFTNRL